jgi:hypothetical protein
MSTVSQGKLVGSKDAAFRRTSTSKPDDWSDNSGKDVGAARNFAHEKAAVNKANDSKAKKEQDIINRTKAAAQRAKETLRMAKEEISEAKGKWIPDRPMKVHVAAMDKRDTADLKGMHDRWSGDHIDKKSDPSTSERLLAVHHVLKKRGESVPDLPQHRNLGRTSYVKEESSGTEARVKIKNVARPDDAESTSEKSKLSKQAEIKTKIVEERPTMSKIDFGLSSSLINATRSIMEKKHAKEAKTDVDLDPETNDKLDDENGDDDDDVKKESKKHTSPKSHKEKKLAALAHPKDKITHKDVLVGRGVLKKEETEIEEAIKPYVSYSGPRPGKSPSATVMAAGEKPHKTFSKDEHGADYKQKAMDYFKKNMKKLHSEEVESDVDSLTEEQLEEVLKKSDPAGKWISDFVHSKNPKFEGKSKKERMKQALGAYYAKQRNEEVEIEEGDQFATKRRLDLIAKQEKKLPAGISPERKALAIRKQKAMKAHKAAQGMKEEEQLDEISKATLQSYTKGAKKEADSARKELQYSNRMARDFGQKSDVKDLQTTIRKRTLGTDLAKAKMNKSGRSGYMHANVPAREEFEFTAEELERIESIAAQLDEAKPTIVSAPIRGANQDQSGFGVKKNTADYTISDEKKVRKEEVEIEEQFVVYHKDSKKVVSTHANTATAKKHAEKRGADYAVASKEHWHTKLNPTRKSTNEEIELEEGRGRPKKSGGEAEGDDTHRHPIQQLTKISHAIEGSEPHFEHKDGAKTKVGKHLAKHVMAVYGSMRTSQEKDDFANKLHASKDSMKSAVSKLF